MINIVVPMAGRGSRFASAGFTRPKPLILVHGLVPMIQLVVDNLTPRQEHRFIFLCLQDHLDEYDLDSQLKSIAPGAVVVPVQKVTEGAACTVLLAKEYVDNDDALMIANSDQWVRLDVNEYLEGMAKGGFDGYIMTMKSDDPKWSYIGFTSDGRIDRVAEKVVISDEATVGIYNFAKGNLFVKAAEEMIRRNLRVNNEFYVAPAYNLLIDSGANLGFYNVGREYNGMHGLGIPEDLGKFENLAWTRKVAEESRDKIR
jgi:NDP-sugar pyrophosphorylase family protein